MCVSRNGRGRIFSRIDCRGGCVAPRAGFEAVTKMIPASVRIRRPVIPPRVADWSIAVRCEVCEGEMPVRAYPHSTFMAINRVRTRWQVIHPDWTRYSMKSGDFHDLAQCDFIHRPRDKARLTCAPRHVTASELLTVVSRFNPLQLLLVPLSQPLTSPEIHMNPIHHTLRQ